MKNEKGSIALVLIIVFVIGISISVLTQVLLAEKLTARDVAETTLSSFYQEDQAIEFTKNLVSQKILEKKWEGEIAEQKIIEKVDLYEIETILNDELPLSENTGISVSLTDLEAEDLKVYCEEMYEVTFNTTDSPQFLGYDCQKLKTEFSFILTLNDGYRSKNLKMTFSEIYPYVTNKGNTIMLNSSEKISKVKSK